MLLKNKEIYSLYEVLASFRNDKSDKFPIYVNFALVCNLRQLEPIFITLDAGRVAIIEKYRDITSEGQVIIPENKVSKFNDEMNKLMNVTSDINLTKVRLDNLDNLGISIAELEALYPIIEIDQD